MSSIVYTALPSHRQASPDLFAAELAASLDIIGRTPDIGRVYRLSPAPDTRRVLLKATRYHVYYVPLADEVRVLAVWHPAWDGRLDLRHRISTRSSRPILRREAA
jgi:plasmid stabilization system protein ParE